MHATAQRRYINSELYVTALCVRNHSNQTRVLKLPFEVLKCTESGATLLTCLVFLTLMSISFHGSISYFKFNLFQNLFASCCELFAQSYCNCISQEIPAVSICATPECFEIMVDWTRRALKELLMPQRIRNSIATKRRIHN